MKKPLRLSLILFASLCTVITPLASSMNTTQGRNTFTLPPSVYTLPLGISANYSLVTPRCNIPVILEAGNTFTITFTADAFTAVYAYLSTAYEPVVDTYWLSLTNITQHNTSWTMTAAVPPVATKELYNLTLLFNADGVLLTSTQPRAVSITHISNTFTFIQISDFHLGDPRGIQTSIRQTLYERSLLRTVNEVNLLHPDFILMTGDLVYGQPIRGVYAQEYPKLYDILQKFDEPTFLVPGNHDGINRIGEDGFTYWRHYFGPMNFSFNYGSVHFIGVNSFDMTPRERFGLAFAPLYWGGAVSNEQLAWINNDLNQTTNATSTIMFLHHNPLWDCVNNSLDGHHYTNQQGLLATIASHHIAFVLSGHVHWDSLNVVNGTTFITTTTPESSICKNDSYWGYRLITVVNGTVASYNYKDPYYSIPLYHLQASFSKNLRTAIVTSSLEKNETGVLRFVLPDAQYTVSPGAILEERHDGTHVELYVQVAIPMNSTQTVTVTRSLALE